MNESEPQDQLSPSPSPSPSPHPPPLLLADKLFVGLLVGAIIMGSTAVGFLAGKQKPQAPAATTSAPAPVPQEPLLSYNRPWLVAGAVGHFVFTDEEWALLTNQWPSLDGQSFTTSQGAVKRVSQADFEALAKAVPASVRTNLVWFGGR